MIVCVCHAVTETSCGCCVDAVKALVVAQHPPCGKEVPCPGCECVEQGVRAEAA